MYPFGWESDIIIMRKSFALDGVFIAAAARISVRLTRSREIRLMSE